jgi:UDP-GlcNAc3NAcA epimerase
MKILTVVGARPQFVKASVVSRAIAQRVDVSEVVVHTGQHFDTNMSDVFFAELGVPTPRHYLGIGGGGHGAMTGRMLVAIEDVLSDECPDVVLVYGDTNSTLAGALAAVKLHIPVAHVEAGLRSFNLRMPEEVNRVLTDRISRWLFAPTEAAVEHLRREGFPADSVHLVGDVMLDVARHFGELAPAPVEALGHKDGTAREYVLVTVHRAENTDEPARLRVIAEALVKVSARVPVVWPLHPRTRRVLEGMGLMETLRGCVRVTDPVGYIEMVGLEKHAAVIATDSGGVQKEAFFFGVPCVTLRDETEWTELVDLGWNRLVPLMSKDQVSQAILGSIGRTGTPASPYGYGDAAMRIVNVLCAP